ncbi:hypothetical protein HanIR_Chr01g0028051 [Helianthus annuus]|nr:hypothetical protein HanIR_Chr01g0028051 [Helianthus annuus]
MLEGVVCKLVGSGKGALLLPEEFEELWQLGSLLISHFSRVFSSYGCFVAGFGRLEGLIT